MAANSPSRCLSPRPTAHVGAGIPFRFDIHQGISPHNCDFTEAKRVRYDAYGKRSVYAPNLTALVGTGIGQMVTFTGRFLDSETGLVYFRARQYSTGLGRFVGRDPIGYFDGSNIYRAYFVSNGLDPIGLAVQTLDVIDARPGSPGVRISVDVDEEKCDLKFIKSERIGSAGYSTSWGFELGGYGLAQSVTVTYDFDVTPKEVTVVANCPSPNEATPAMKNLTVEVNRKHLEVFSSTIGLFTTTGSRIKTGVVGTAGFNAKCKCPAPKCAPPSPPSTPKGPVDL